MTKKTQTADLYERAVMFATRDNRPYVAYLHRRLEIPYADAARLIRRMQDEKLISEPDYMGKRVVLVPYVDRQAA